MLGNMFQLFLDGFLEGGLGFKAEFLRMGEDVFRTVDLELIGFHCHFFPQLQYFLLGLNLFPVFDELYLQLLDVPMLVGAMLLPESSLDSDSCRLRGVEVEIELLELCVLKVSWLESAVLEGHSQLVNIVMIIDRVFNRLTL